MNQYSQQDFTSWSLQEIRDLQRKIICSKDITTFLEPNEIQQLCPQISNFHELLITAVLANPSLIQSIDYNLFFKKKIFPKIIQQTKSRILSKAFYLLEPIDNFDQTQYIENDLLDQIKKDNLNFIQHEYPNYRNDQIVFVHDELFPSGTKLTLLEASAYFGAINIFRYVKAKSPIINRTFYLTILGNQIDIAKYLILEDNNNINIFVHFIGCAVKYHRDSFIQMIQENVKEDQKKIVKRIIFRKAVIYMNFEYINEQFCEGIFFLENNQNGIKDAKILTLLEKTKGVKWNLLKNYFYPVIRFYQSFVINPENKDTVELKIVSEKMSNLTMAEYITLFPIKKKMDRKLFQSAFNTKDFQALYYYTLIFGNKFFFYKMIGNDNNSYCSNAVYETPLSCLMKCGTKESFELFKKLLKNPKINPNTTFQSLHRNMYGTYNTLLTYGVRNKKYDYVRLLLKNPKININCPEETIELAWYNGCIAKTKIRPLAIAIELGDIQMIKIFVKKCGYPLNKYQKAEYYMNQDSGESRRLNYKEFIKKQEKKIDPYIKKAFNIRH